MGVYPFMFGTAKDFEPIVEEMDKVLHFHLYAYIVDYKLNTHSSWA